MYSLSSDLFSVSSPAIELRTFASHGGVTDMQVSSYLNNLGKHKQWGGDYSYGVFNYPLAPLLLRLIINSLVLFFFWIATFFI